MLNKISHGFPLNVHYNGIYTQRPPHNKPKELSLQTSLWLHTLPSIRWTCSIDLFYFTHTQSRSLLLSFFIGENSLTTFWRSMKLTLLLFTSHFSNFSTWYKTISIDSNWIVLLWIYSITQNWNWILVCCHKMNNDRENSTKLLYCLKDSSFAIRPHHLHKLQLLMFRIGQREFSIQR